MGEGGPSRTVKYETDSKVLFDIRALLQQILRILENKGRG